MSVLHADTARVTSKGQLVIPVAIRRRHGIRKGTRVRFIERGPEIVLEPVHRGLLDSLYGALKDAPSLLDDLLAERARERSREDARGGDSLGKGRPR